jgi:hypothetical protein
VEIEKTARQASLEDERDDTPGTETVRTLHHDCADVFPWLIWLPRQRKADSKRSKRQRTKTLQESDVDSRSPSQDFEPLPLDAAARSDNESIYAESLQETTKKNRSERKTSARRPANANTEKRVSRSEKGVATNPFLPEAELYYPPVTASGEPVLLEAADKRMKIVEAEGVKKRTSTRALALPFGMPYSRMVEWNIMVSFYSTARIACCDSQKCLCPNSTIWTGNSGDLTDKQG